MPGSDDFVQVAADGIGKKVDTTLITRPDGSQVERQRVDLAEAGQPLELLVSINNTLKQILHLLQVVTED